jgi:methylglutaconyl-CoA hydratase
MLLYHTQNRIAYLTLDRPEKRNALDDKLVTALSEGFTQAGKDPEVKLIVLKANGKAFCAGADLAYLQQLRNNTFEENLADSTHLKNLFEQIYHLPKPVIAQVQGHALAGGCGLATVCDLVFTVPEARFGYTEVRIGFIPAIVMYFLLRKTGETRARELLLSGETIDAPTAERYGLVNFIVPAEELEAQVRGYAENLATKNSGQAMALTKKMLARMPGLDAEQALTFAAEMNATARQTEDCRRGIDSFLNKEEIKW